MDANNPTIAQSQAQARSAPPVRMVVTSDETGALPLEPGRHVVARVLQVDMPHGVAKIALAGQTLTVHVAAPVEVGQVLDLTVGHTENGSISLTLERGGGAGAVSAALSAAQPDGLAELPSMSGTAGGGNAVAGLGTTSSRALARAGVPATPGMVQALSSGIARLVTQAGGANAAGASAAEGSGSAPGDFAASLASLAARGLPLTSALAVRVSAAYDAAGELGASIAQLANASPQVAAALPANMPGATAVRVMVSANLSHPELALAALAEARFAATQATLAGDATAAQAVAANAEITTASTSTAAAAAPAGDQTAQTAATGADPVANTAPGATAGGSIAGQPIGAGSDVVDRALAARVAGATAQLQPSNIGAAPESAAFTATNSDAGSADAGVREPGPQASVSAQTAPSIAAQSAVDSDITPPSVAVVIANLATVLARFATSAAPGVGITAPNEQAAAQQERIATQALPAGSFTPEAAGGAADGSPAPLVTTPQQVISSVLANVTDNAAVRAQASNVAQFDSAQLASALQTLPQQSSLQFVSSLMAAIPGDSAALVAGGGAGMAASLAQLQHAVGGALNALGQQLAQTDPNGAAASAAGNLRQALQTVSTNDPRASVRASANNVIAALDGQAILSAPRMGADPGFIYFQMPLPSGSNAEVLVRRDPGRRKVSFDQFDIAFLLHTEALGNLMVRLEAHPIGVRTTISTDRPQAVAYLKAQAAQLKAHVEQEANRPVVVTVGTFGPQGAPKSLLDDASGVEPGETRLYA